MLCDVNTSRRQLGLGAAIAIVTGESVALGIFLTPATMSKELGSPLLLLLVWLGMALMALCGALCYSELAVRFPESGGDYVYLREGYGERIAFLYGWMSSIVMYPGVAAALAIGVAAYIGTLLPASSFLVRYAPAALLIGFGGVNLFGTAFSGRLLSALNVLKFLILFSLVGWAAVSGHAHLANLQPFTARRPGSDPLLGAVAGAIVSAFFSFGGWWEAGKIAGEVRNPQRNLPIAFLGGVALVTAAYLLISFAFLSVIPLSTLSSSVAFVSQFGEALFGSSGAKVLSGCVLLCVCGGMSALMMAAPRVCYAMASAGSFFSLFARLHPRYGTPWNAILLQTALSLLVLFFGAFDRMLSFIIFTVILFLALTASTLFRQPVRAWWYPVAPVTFVACSVIVALLILMHDPLPALIGTGIVLCGDPARKWITRHQKVQETFVLEREYPMPHIALPEGLHGIRSAMSFRPDTAKPLNELAELLLHAPNSLTQGERELIATYVSSQNDCYFCQTVHGAIASACLDDNESLVKHVKTDFMSAAISDKLKALLVIAGKVQIGGKLVTSDDVAAAKAAGARDMEIHDTVLIAAAFCMYNRYVDGLATWQPVDDELYRERGKKIAREGYVTMSKEYLPAETNAR